MDIKSLATQLIMDKIGAANDSGAAETALDELAGGGGFDLHDIVGQFTGAGGDLASKAASWLGDGGNESISPAQIQDALGGDKIEAFAAKLGIGREQASSGLSEILPNLIDKSSKSGSLLDSAGDVSRLAGLATKFFK